MLCLFGEKSWVGPEPFLSYYSSTSHISRKTRRENVRRSGGIEYGCEDKRHWQGDEVCGGDGLGVLYRRDGLFLYCKRRERRQNEEGSSLDESSRGNLSTSEDLRDP